MWSRCTFKQRGTVFNKINTGIEGSGELRRRERYRCISKCMTLCGKKGYRNSLRPYVIEYQRSL